MSLCFKISDKVMTLAERQEVGKQIVHFYSKIPDFNKYETVSHFKKQGFKS